MRKPIIGIISTLTMNNETNIFHDVHKVINSYTKKITESGGVPIGIVMPDGNINLEALELCDGILIPGGNKVYRYLIQTLQFAIIKNKPVLGICLGGEAISIFSALSKKIDFSKNLSLDETNKIWQELKIKNNNELLIRLPKDNYHSNKHIKDNDFTNAKHPILIKKDSLIYDIYNKTEIQGVSFHAFDFKLVEGEFTISGYAPDGVKEVIEHTNPEIFMLGVHFHPELEKENLLFNRLIYESQKRLIKSIKK